MAMAGRPTKGRTQSQRNSTTRRGVDAQATRGNQAKNKDKLGSDRDRTMSTKPAANRDEFGSRHNRDDRTRAQQKKGREGGHANLAFRESAQDVRKPKGKGRLGEDLPRRRR